MHLKATAAAAVFMAAGIIQATPASACSQPLPTLHTTTPEEGAMHPSNANVWLHGRSLSLDDLAVTVDGAPASLIPSSDPRPTSVGAAARVDPEPAPGQQIVITGDACASVEAGNCTVNLSYTTAAPDEVAPSVDGLSLSYDVFDYPDFDGEVGACEFDSDLAYFVDLSFTSVGEDETPVFFQITGYDSRTDETAFTFSALSSEGEQQRFERRLLGGGDALPDDPAAICLRVELYDAAGNLHDPAVDTCAACRYRNSDDGSVATSEPDEPVWTPADIHVGGPCDDGTATGEGAIPPGSNGEQVATSGCNAASGAATSGWFFISLAIGLVRVRRLRSR